MEYKYSLTEIDLMKKYVLLTTPRLFDYYDGLESRDSYNNHKNILRKLILNGTNLNDVKDKVLEIIKDKYLKTTRSGVRKNDRIEIKKYINKLEIYLSEVNKYLNNV